MPICTLFQGFDRSRSRGRESGLSSSRMQTDGKRLILKNAAASTIHRMDRTFMLIGVVAAFIGVGFGAFGAHGLRGRTSPEMLAVFETGVRYQMYHAFAILITALALSRLDAPLIRWAGWLFTAGIVIFSGSLYALVLTGTSSLGAITPFGGIAFLAGWACLAIAALL